MRVCFALTAYPPRFAGHGIQIQRNLPHLLERGITSTVLTESLAGSGKRPPEEINTVHRVLSPGRRALARARRVLELRRHFRERARSYDVVHSQIVGWEFILNLRFLKSQGLAVVFEMVLLDGDDAETIARSRFGSMKIALMRRYVDRWIGLTRVFLPRVTSVGIPEEKFRVVYGGVDVTRYAPPDGEGRRALRRKLDLPADGRVVVSAGSVIPRKGMDRVIRAWSQIRPRPGRDVLLIVGPAKPTESMAAWDPSHFEEVCALAEGPRAKGTVRIVGEVDNLHDYFGASDLFVFLSRREGLGYVTLEAMASGLPVVVSPLDGIAHELVKEGRTGQIAANPEDPEAVGALLAGLLDDPDRCRRMGDAARRSVIERFSLEARAAALDEIYRELLEARRGPRS